MRKGALTPSLFNLVIRYTESLGNVEYDEHPRELESLDYRRPKDGAEGSGTACE
jgi:hypothetical protein